MLKNFSRWLLYRVMGWRKEVSISAEGKFIICLAPHTSNWDFIIGQLYAHAEGLKSNFLMKKEWFVWPLGVLFRRMGGIPVWRSKHVHTTDILADYAMKSSSFHLCVTPEGTRSLNPKWKRGFYFIAQKAGLPILLYGIDYKKRLIQCTRQVIPTGNVEEEMKEIKLYFKDFQGKNPEKFTLGDI